MPAGPAATARSCWPPADGNRRRQGNNSDENHETHEITRKDGDDIPLFVRDISRGSWFDCQMRADPEQLLAFLRDHQVLTLAVADEDGPHAAALFYAVDDDLRLFVLTNPRTRHGRAMCQTAPVAGTIQRDRQVWNEIQGIQFRGRCHRLRGPDRARGWTLYTERFPFLKEKHRVLAVALKRMALWRIDPDWIRWIDNRRGFGHREEWKGGRLRADFKSSHLPYFHASMLPSFHPSLPTRPMVIRIAT